MSNMKSRRRKRTSMQESKKGIMLEFILSVSKTLDSFQRFKELSLTVALSIHLKYSKNASQKLKREVTFSVKPSLEWVRLQYLC